MRFSSRPDSKQWGEARREAGDQPEAVTEGATTRAARNPACRAGSVASARHFSALLKRRPDFTICVPRLRDQWRSKRSAFVTLAQAATKCFTNLSPESAHA